MKDKKNEKEGRGSLFENASSRFFSGPTPRSLSRKKWEFSWLTSEEAMVRISFKWKRRITCKLIYHYMWEFWEQKNASESI